jgi:hypothetical protein
MIILLLACQSEILDSKIQEPTPAVLLKRISLDLRGTLPSVEAMQEVNKYPETMDKWIDLYFQSTELKERWVHLLNERWHTRIDFSPVIFYEEYHQFSGDSTLEYSVERAILEEPLRLMTEVIANDEPWTTIVLADWTMANDILAEIWPLDYSGDGNWSTATWTDQRPAAGVLSSNGLWKRYYSTPSNMNRQRAAAISKLLICEDYTERKIDFTQLNPDENIENALQENPYCLGCHSSLDPIAAALFGFYSPIPVNVDEHDVYHPERELLAESLLGTRPAWFGLPINGLADLGYQIANDPRFTSCAVQTFASLLWKRDIEVEDHNTIANLQQEFIANDQRPQTIIRSLLYSQEYKQRSARIVMPDQYAATLHQLTGFQWNWQGYNQMDNDTYGFRVMAGGVDGSYVLTPQTGASFTQTLVVQRLAEAAAWTVVHHDLILDQNPKRLLTEVTVQTNATDDSFVSQMERLHWQLYASEASTQWIQSIQGLWQDIYTEQESQIAWHGVLSAIFQDPELMVY